MKKSILIESAERNKRFLALLIDTIIMLVSFATLFILVFAAILVPSTKYNDKLTRITEIENSYNLNYDYTHPYDDYLNAVKDVYLTYYPQEIFDNVKASYPAETYTSIEHIFNVFVLGCPREPAIESNNYKGDYFQYQIDLEQGKVFQDQVGIVRPDKSGPTFEANLKKYCYNKYNFLRTMLLNYDKEYRANVEFKENIEIYSRSISAGVTALVFGFIIPLLFGNGQSIGDKLAHVGYINKKDNLRIKPYKAIIRGFVFYIIPVLGFVLYNKYALAAMIALPIFINFLLIAFRNDCTDLRDFFSKTVAVDMDESKIFDSIGQASLYSKKEENQVITDQDYLSALENMDTMNFNESRSDELNLDHSKKDKKD